MSTIFHYGDFWCRLLFKIECFMYSILFSFAYINFNWNVLHPYTNSTLQVTFTYAFNISSHRKYYICVSFRNFFSHFHDHYYNCAPTHIVYHDQRKEIFKHPLIFPCANQNSIFLHFSSVCDPSTDICCFIKKNVCSLSKNKRKWKSDAH